jgi:gamma-butyrobetaine dioxygenase
MSILTNIIPVLRRVNIFSYCQSPPRYQILHCLRNRVSGGSSIFVDAIRVAEDLRGISPVDYNILATTPVAFHYINNGHHLYYEHPTIQLPYTSSSIAHSVLEHGVNATVTRDVSPDFINYSPPFQGPLPLTTPANFYPAFKRFSEMLEDKQYQFKYLLKEGDAVLFDNRRVLHARTAFRDLEKSQTKTLSHSKTFSALGSENSVQEGDTNRWLKGCYLEADAMLDRGRILRGKIRDELSH